MKAVGFFFRKVNFIRKLSKVFEKEQKISVIGEVAFLRKRPTNQKTFNFCLRNFDFCR